MGFPDSTEIELIKAINRQGTASTWLATLTSDVAAATTLATMAEDTTAGYGGRQSILWGNPTGSPPIATHTNLITWGPYTANVVVPITAIALVDAASGSTYPGPAVTPPVLSVAAVASGGTFAAGTYYWKVTTTTAAGETSGSNEVSVAVVLNGSATLSWAAVTGATGYKVYRGTVAGAENVLVASPATNGYTDTGSAGSASTVPATSTAGNTAIAGSIRRTWPLNTQFAPKIGDTLTLPIGALTLGIQ